MRIFKARFGEEDIQELRKQGRGHNCILHGTFFDEARNIVYKGTIDIRAWFPKDEVPTWMDIRVDTSDGVPWLVNFVFKIPGIPRALKEVEEKARELAEQFGLSASRVLISVYQADPLQHFDFSGQVLQINSVNEDPEKLLSFLEATERMLQAAH